jgi:hypothetical protein
MTDTNLFAIPGDVGGKPQLLRFVVGAPACLAEVLPLGFTPDQAIDVLFAPDRGVLVQIQLVGDVGFLLPIPAGPMSSN